MNTFLVVLLVATASTTFAAQVCYTNIGCFTDDPPFDLLPLPQDPSVKRLQPTYYLYRKGQGSVVITDSKKLGSDVIFIVHGFTESVNAGWRAKMVQKLHEVRPNADIVYFDWEKGAAMGAGLTIYTQAASNTRSYGAALAYFIQSNTALDSSKYYCIGFSLGAQVCGFAGKSLTRRWGRITAIDPAAPGFSERNDTRARVAKSDAALVDVIHTSKVGLWFAVGHIDFWVNDAKQQPGCMDDFQDNNPLTNINNFFSCSHLRAPPLYTETVNPATGCSFPFCPCASMSDYQAGKCKTCSTSVGQQLGYKANLSPNRGEFYGATTGSAPFCPK